MWSKFSLDVDTTPLKPLSLSKLVALLGLSGLSCFFYKTVRLYLVKNQFKHIPGPETKGILEFYFGNVTRIHQLIQEGKHFSDMIVENQKIYGDTFKYQIFDDMIVFTMNRDAIKEIFFTKDYPKNERIIPLIGFPFNYRFLGYGLVTELDNTKWKHRRGIFNSGFQRAVLMTFVDTFNQTAEVLMERLRKFSDGKTSVRLFNEINRATLDAIGKIAFGMDIDSINNVDSKFSVYITQLTVLLEEFIHNPFAKFNPFKYPKIRQVGRMIEFLRNAGREKLFERLNSLQNGEELPDDILSNILKSFKESDDFDVETMLDDFMTFYLAGQETTANTLAFAFLELGRHPEVLAKVIEEVDRVLGKRSEISYNDITELRYCSAVFKESLRLWPPVPVTIRRAPDNVVIDGYHVPKHTLIHVSTYANARQEKFFKYAEEFRPERFLKDSDTMQTSVENYTYFPFSLGPRNCIGQNFAQIEGVVMIAKFVQKFEFKLDPNQTFKVEQALTMKPKDGTKCFITLRS